MKTTGRVRRNFRGSAPSMLLGISTIAGSAINHAAELLRADTTFTPEYLEDFRKRLDRAIREVLGADRAEDFRHATTELRASSNEAAAELGLTQTWIEGKFKKDPDRRDELLNDLGFTAFFTNAVYRRRSKDMMQLLLRFDERMDAELAEEFVALGLPVSRLATLHKLADGYSTQKLIQTEHKGHRTELTEDATQLLNGLFDEAMAISQLAKKLFRNDPATRATFTYGKATAAPGKGKNNSKDAGSPQAA